MGMILYDLLSVGKTVPGHDMLKGTKAIENEPGLRREGLLAAARYYDAQVAFAERLVLENLLAARAAGAEIRTYSEVTRINVADGAVTGLEFTDTLSGEHEQCDARVVINAGGPWVDEVLATAGTPAKKFIGGTVGSHIIVSKFEGAPGDAYYVEAESDGRPFFIIPWNDLYLIGTTDIRYDGSLDEVRASPAEVDYLLKETNRVFPSAKLRRDDIHYAYAGIRPLPRREHGPESSITRKHIIKKNRQLARGLISIIGGKLTTFRHLAEQTVDKTGKELGRKLPGCRTQETLLPGAYRVEEAEAVLASVATLTESDRSRLLALYGGRAIDVVRLVGAEADDLLEAQVIFAIREEMARTLADIVYRRLMTGLDADQGRPDYERIAAIAAKEFGWSDEQRRSQLDALVAYSDSFQSALH
jgi:glycerol-3-phosphate dehydrogenase